MILGAMFSLILAAANAPAVAGDIPSAVLWLGGFAAFVGFIFGSVPPGPYGGSQFDMGGALVSGLGLGGLVGGAALIFVTGALLPGAIAAVLGGVFVLTMVLNRRPRR